MTGSIIEARNVSKVLGNGPARVQALKDVSLTLNGGELTVLWDRLAAARPPF